MENTLQWNAGIDNCFGRSLLNQFCSVSSLNMKVCHQQALESGVSLPTLYKVPKIAHRVLLFDVDWWYYLE
jgi:hypothetical protein